MKIIEELLKDDFSFEQAEAIQIKYQKFINKSSKSKDIIKIEQIHTIVGVDISYYSKDNYEYGIACAVIWNLKLNKKEKHFFYNDHIRFPYKPGFLGFRECKLLAKVISRIPKRPNLIMCDGHGKIHPRRFGEAVQLGLALNIPSIGVAKNPFIGFFNYDEIEKLKGNKAPIWAKNPTITVNKHSNELLGYAVCLNDYSKPILISEGYKTTLDTAIKVCLKTVKGHRQPEPLYLADFLSRKKVNKFVS